MTPFSRATWLSSLLACTLSGQGCARNSAASERGTKAKNASSSGLSAEAESTGGLRAVERYEAEVAPGQIAAAQPSQQRLRDVVSQGATVISLRYPSENPFDEKGLVEGRGGTFIRYPTAAPSYRDPGFRSKMYDLFDAQQQTGKSVYLHCASSNRVGAGWALYQDERKGVPAGEALEMGRRAGMGSLQSLVVSVLGL